MSDHAFHPMREPKHVDDDGSRRDDDPKGRVGAADNLALQSLLRAGVLHAKLRVGAPRDPAEARADEADLLARLPVRRRPPAPAPRPRSAVASCREGATTIRRSVKGTGQAARCPPSAGFDLGRPVGGSATPSARSSKRACSATSIRCACTTTNARSVRPTG